MLRKLTFTVFTIAVLLRLLLFWGNPPSNVFDNHYEPISYIVSTGKIPPKDACFQCYHPPVFYYSSAIAAKTLNRIGISDSSVTKSLQFINCLYGILTLIVLYLIMIKLRLSEFSRFIAFSFVCFLPRHIFMSVIHSNDTLTYLAISLCVYLLLVSMDRGFLWHFSALLGAIVTLTIFVKYTAFIVLPMIAIPLITLLILKSTILRARIFTALFFALILPLFFLGTYMVDNHNNYGRVLPWNDTIINTAAIHPRDIVDVNFVSFTPWQFIKEPIIMPGQLHSFWTLIYSGMWIDSEPKFTDFTDKNDSWWNQYFSWMGGTSIFPATPNPISIFTRAITSGLIVFGFVPLILIVIGLVRSVVAVFPRDNSGTAHEIVTYQIFPIMLFFNTLGIILLVLKAPVYSSMKASYFLNSLPAFIVFIALGVQYIERWIWCKMLLVASCCAITFLTSLYVSQMLWALIPLK